MPPFDWPVDPMPVVSDFEQRHARPDAGALILFGVWAVDSLYYLSDVDAQDDLSQPTINGHRPDVVDVAHARWATGTCITALDLCSAGLGRALCNHTASRELSITDFTPNEKFARVGQRRALLPDAALRWIDEVIGDDGYKTIKAARHALTHARVRRHFTMPRQRLQIQAGDIRLDVPTLLVCGIDTVTKHVRRLLQILPSI